VTQSSGSPAPAAAPVPAAASTPPTTQFALKTNGSDSANDLPNLAATSVDFYPGINSTLSTSNPGPVQWPQSRPTLTGGSISGRMSGLSFQKD
jgi:transcription initiation factor TFIID subunit 12